MFENSTRVLALLIWKLPGSLENLYVNHLLDLEDSKLFNSSAVSKFCTTEIKIRHNWWQLWNIHFCFIHCFILLRVSYLVLGDTHFLPSRLYYYFRLNCYFCTGNYPTIIIVYVTFLNSCYASILSHPFDFDFVLVFFKFCWSLTD